MHCCVVCILHNLCVRIAYITDVNMRVIKRTIVSELATPADLTA